MMRFFFPDWKNGLGQGLVQIIKMYMNLKFTVFTLQNTFKIHYFLAEFTSVQQSENLFPSHVLIKLHTKVSSDMQVFALVFAQRLMCRNSLEKSSWKATQMQ